MAMVLAPSAVFLGLYAMGQFSAKQNRFKNVTADDRAHVVTASDLGLEVDPKREYLKKSEEDDGTLRLTYRYPDTLEPGDAVSLECIAIQAPDAAAAQKVVDAVRAEVSRSLVMAP